MRISDFKLLDSSNLINETNSDSFPLEHLIGFAMSVVFTASSSFTGILVLQASNDDLNWHDIACENVSGTSGSKMFNVTSAFYKHVRLKVKITTGEVLTITAKVYTKGW